MVIQSFIETFYYVLLKLKLEFLILILTKTTTSGKNILKRLTLLFAKCGDLIKNDMVTILFQTWNIRNVFDNMFGVTGSLMHL